MKQSAPEQNTFTPLFTHPLNLYTLGARAKARRYSSHPESGSVAVKTGSEGKVRNRGTRRVGSVQGPSSGRSGSLVGKLPLRDTPGPDLRRVSRTKAPAMQEEVGAEPKREPTRLGLRNERERAGRGKGRPRRAKRGSYSRAGDGGAAGRGGGCERTGRREGERERSSGRAGPGRSGRGGAERPSLGPAQAVSARALRDRRRAGPQDAARGPVEPGRRDAVPRPLPVASGLSPPRSWGAPATHSRRFRSSLPIAAPD